MPSGIFPVADVLRRRPRYGTARLGLLCLCLCGTTGCTWISYLGTDERNEHLGKTFYVGGAGPFGHVGTIDVPKGLRNARYRGAIEVFGWQSIVGGTLRDQLDRSRNGDQARRLAAHIRDYLKRHPGRRVNIIALSAGTGIAAWALEDLTEEYHVGTVVFLGSSLSRHYDLTPALSRIDGVLYNFYSPGDRILRYTIPIAGSVDREFQGPSVAGLFGFAPPEGATPQVRQTYEQRVRNMPWRRLYSRYGYDGGHIDSTSRAFIARFVAPLLIAPLPQRAGPEAQLGPSLPGSPPAERPPVSEHRRPAAPPAGQATRELSHPAPLPQRR